MREAALIKSIFARLLHNTEGTSIVEYGLIVGLVGVAIVLALDNGASAVNRTMSKVGATLVLETGQVK